MLIPETCWDRIFQVAKLLRDTGVRVCAIPNIEIVRRSEIYKHNYFHKILANNYFCQEIFQKHLDIPCRYIGYACSDNKDIIDISHQKDISREIKFLFIGGMNVFSRKNVTRVLKAFVRAFEKNKNIRLTVTIQKLNLLEQDKRNILNQYLGHQAISIIQNHLTHEEIIDLYHTHHVFIQVSKHEGLGLGFYESISTNTPVITLNTPPHNEIIHNNVNGWIIDCYYKPMTDNNEALFQSAYFRPNKLRDKILEIALNPEIINTMITSLIQDKIQRHSSDVFGKIFLEEIN
ncbi:MAG: glycosyltransferase [Dasosvirus sp.]|uniref:Glycosyltransferase n=1 Tax=Dasosvirus sp. TaxID=2487764 RepID=A0A3G4ZS00_9VIRU|nr:MAG: glycosyltransferase [Dasosvirus sp.]